MRVKLILSALSGCPLPAHPKTALKKTSFNLFSVARRPQLVQCLQLGVQAVLTRGEEATSPLARDGECKGWKGLKSEWEINTGILLRICRPHTSSALTFVSH